ncbi:MerR family transcriptional regulator [Paenibacillus sp. 1001270B_150601_E10]|uniref:MerR family transcriptional regulator n=1 Tax=Paenibacillus sp. 1001270B_150601_E10 TaxID=2787079 RepID=UPI00189E6DFC|nr:MerR family transcriptional regulator [Paenibacillus sp. 1001270B_150601_E10]
MKLYRIGELARATSLSQRTIDYYTKIGLIEPAQRTNTNYRLYHSETIERLERISQLKQEKYSLDEIKNYFMQLKRVASDSELIKRLTDLQVHMEQVERDAKELQPMLDKMKPKQRKSLLQRISPQSAACIEVLVAILDKQQHLM